MAVMISSFTTFLWVFGLILTFMGESLFSAIGMKEPDFFVWMKQNKIQTIAMLYFVNSFGNAQLATGAFEIYVDDVLRYSKLQTKHLPSADDIIFALKLAGYE